jgi:hypothetical protein
MNSPRLWGYLSAWFAMMISILLGLGSLNWLEYRHLEQRGMAVKAVVTDLQPENHATAAYSYRVNNIEYAGLSQLRDPNPDLENVKVGTWVMVWYDVANPSYSIAGFPKDALNNETISIVLASLGMPTFVIFAWHVRRRKTRLKSRTGNRLH